MKRIVTCRYGGKTTRLIRESHQTGNYIVCMNPHAVQTLAQELGMTIPFPLTYNEFISKKFYAKGIKGFLIDDVDYLIQEMSGSVPVNTITMSTDDK